MEVLFDNREGHGLQAAMEDAEKAGCEAWHKGVPIELSDEERQRAKKWQAQHDCGMLDFGEGLILSCDLRNTHDTKVAPSAESDSASSLGAANTSNTVSTPSSASEAAPSDVGIPDDPKGYVGKSPLEILNDPLINPQIRALVGDQYDLFVSNMSGPFHPAELKGNYYVAYTCGGHACGDEESVFAIDKNTGQVFASMRIDGKITNFGVSDVKDLPPPLYEWYVNVGGQIAMPQSTTN
ncbi:MAG TPA: hypothetical protein VFW00_06365 [Rhodocyclaceae bacterium]|nr:hypothetical protein [Rhodocyclaceae bacterium]